ncbi:MAG: bifunctional folylpolyglutamate synthase/dihydrofolate synthase, partial [bacterium]
MFKNDTLVFLDNLKRFGWKLGLKNISDVLSAIGNPHHRFQCIHIGGTNGKGSTAAFLDSILRQSGYKIGLFTSPHLLEINERIQVGGQRISDGEFSRRVSDMKSILTEKGCTYFEAVTAVAFQYFADAGIDIAIIEVGLGGRFDATNVVHSLVSMITNVDLDHTEWLGQSRTAIAKEKAGIIKPDGCCLSGSEDKNVNLVLKQAAHEKNARFFELDRFFTYHVNHMSAQGAEFNLEIAETLYKDIRINLVGEHQIRNAALAVMTCHILREQNIPVGKQDICRGLRNANWPARLQLLLARPQIVVDVA